MALSPPPLLVVGLFCAGLGVACEADNPPDESVDPLSWAVDEAGPYPVGYTSYEVSYRPAAAEEDRTIPIHLWYPATAPTEETAVYEFIFQDDEAFVGAEAEVAVHEGGYPVLVYSHGNQGFAGSSHFVMRALASHGWLAVAPDHIGNTFTTHEDPRPLGLWLWRSGDVSAALDSLAHGGAGASLVPSAAHLDRVVMAGHSFGGYTTWATVGSEFDQGAIQGRCDAGDYPADECSEAQVEAFGERAFDARIAGGIPMAGGGGEDWFGAEGLNAVSVPMFQMSGSLDAGAVAGMWERTTGVDMRWMDVEGGCHQLYGLGACSEVPTEDGFWIGGSYARAFSRHVLLGDTSQRTVALLDGSEILDPRVTFQRREASD